MGGRRKMGNRGQADVPEVLEAYCRKGIKTGAAALNNKARPAATKTPFARDVRRALRTLESETLRSIEDGKSGPVPDVRSLSKSRVLKAAGRGRSQLYGAYDFLVTEIEEAQQRVRQALAAIRRRPVKTKDDLRRELATARRTADLRVRTVASTSLAQLIAKLGPENRRREKFVAEIAELRRRLGEAEQSKKTLAEINRGLLVEVNRKR
jgi:hypothetical protein